MPLTAEQRDFAAAITEFCRRECGTREQRDHLTGDGAHHHNAGIAEQMAESGWLGVAVPAAYGGADGSLTDLCVLLEESARGLAPVSGLGPTFIVGGAYAKFGSEEQKKAVLGGIVAGRQQAIAMSEPQAGSDVGALTCKADRVADGWLINGQKTWCSNAHIAEHILLVARTEQGADKHRGITMFHVPAGTKGMAISGIDTMGGREVNDLYFTDCLLPADAVVGQEGSGWVQLMAGLNLERLILAALMLGRAERVLEDTLAYVRQREQFGRPIGSFQALRHRIADLATELECCKLLVYHVAALADADPDRVLAREASMAKLKVTETAKRAALEGMQMMGGYGYATEYDMEQHVRATLVSTIYGGTSEIQRDIIAKTYGL